MRVPVSARAIGNFCGSVPFQQDPGLPFLESSGSVLPPAGHFIFTRLCNSHSECQGATNDKVWESYTALREREREIHYVHSASNGL